MHEYRRFVQDQLDKRGWDRSTLVRKSGLSRQLVHSIITDSRDHLGQMPDDSTLQRLADGFGISVELVRTAAARSLVGYVDDGSALTIELQNVSTDELLGEIRRRIDAAQATLHQTPPARAPHEATEDQEDESHEPKRRGDRIGRLPRVRVVEDAGEDRTDQADKRHQL